MDTGEPTVKECCWGFIYHPMPCKMCIRDRLLKSGLVSSKSEARRAVEQGGVAVDGEKITDIHASFTADVLSGEGVILKKGKKNFRKVVLK